MRRVYLLAILLLAACAPATVTPTIDPAALPRQLATVDLAAITPPAAALIPTYTPIPPPTIAVIPTATPYIGVFLGDAGTGNLIDLDPARYAGTRVVIVPTADAGLSCAIQPDTVYGEQWQQVAGLVRRLGCAGEPATSYPAGAVQIFERGVMYWLPTGEYFAIEPEVPVGLYWYYPTQPPSAELPPDANPPDGLRLPEDGFGVVWRAYAEVRQGIGYAQIEEQAAQLLLQRFDNGSLLRDAASAQTFVLLRDGSAYGPFN